MGGEGGPKRKTATHPLPPIAEQGKGAGSLVAARFGRAGLGRRPGTRGERAREVLWWGSRPYLGLGWCAEAGRREPAAAGGNDGGGGAAG